MRKTRNGITTKAEDYLERIHELIETKGYARVSDIAEALELTRPTVSIMVQRLSQSGFIDYEKYRGLRLTDEGTRVANRIRDRHAILTKFLTMLDLPEEVVARDTEGIEHHLSGETLEKLARLVSFWEKKPAKLRDALAAAGKFRRRKSS